MNPPVKLDHCVIHVSDWERSNAFYRDVMGAELVQRPVGWAYRFGDKQLNVHGKGVSPAEVARLPVQPGNSDLCFEWDGPIESAIEHLKPLGAIPVSDRVVMDGNIITGAGVASGIDFALAVAAVLEGEEVARQIQLQIEYDPSPPFDSGSPKTASAETVALLFSFRHVKPPEES